MGLCHHVPCLILTSSSQVPSSRETQSVPCSSPPPTSSHSLHQPLRGLHPPCLGAGVLTLVSWPWLSPAIPFPDHLPGEGHSHGVHPGAVICHPGAGLHGHSDCACPSAVRMPVPGCGPGPRRLQQQRLHGVWHLQVRWLLPAPLQSPQPCPDLCPSGPGATLATLGRIVSARRRAAAARNWKEAVVKTTTPSSARGWGTASVDSVCATRVTCPIRRSLGSSANATISTASAMMGKSAGATVSAGGRAERP